MSNVPLSRGAVRSLSAAALALGLAGCAAASSSPATAPSPAPTTARADAQGPGTSTLGSPAMATSILPERHLVGPHRPSFAPPPPPPLPPAGFVGAYSVGSQVVEPRWWDRESPGDLGADWLRCKEVVGTSYLADIPCGHRR